MNAYAEMSREELLHALEGLYCGWEFTLGEQTTDEH